MGLLHSPLTFHDKKNNSEIFGRLINNGKSLAPGVNCYLDSVHKETETCQGHLSIFIHSHDLNCRQGQGFVWTQMTIVAKGLKITSDGVLVG